MAVNLVKNSFEKEYEVDGDVGKHPVTGVRIRVRRRGFRTKRAASDWLVQEKLRFKKGTSQYNVKVSSSVPTIGELYDDWLPTYERDVEKSTLNKTEEYFRLYILPTWKDVPIDKIEVHKLQRYINDMQGKLTHYKQKTNYLHAIVKYALRLDLIDKDPFLKVTMPRERKSSTVVKSFLDVDEFKAFVRVLDMEYAKENLQASTLLRLLAYTGMRSGECLALTWDKIDFVNGRIQITQALGRLASGTYVKTPKSASSMRTVWVPQDMMLKLKTWKKMSQFASATDFVFQHNGETLQIQRPNKWLHDVAEKYHVAENISVHKLRHTWATLAFKQKASVKMVQHNLGHADARISLNIYSDLTKAEAAETAEILSGL